MPALATNDRPRHGAVLPRGRRSPRGRVRWYPVHTGDGREAAALARVRKLVAPELLAGALVPYRERWFKREGAWRLERVRMWQGYLLLATPDARALDRELTRMSSPLTLCGGDGRVYAPLADDTMEWLLGAMDGTGTVRASTGAIEGGVLRVTEGPLVGQEGRVTFIDRHHRCCKVRVSDAGGGFSERLALHVPVKS